MLALEQTQGWELTLGQALGLELTLGEPWGWDEGCEPSLPSHPPPLVTGEFGGWRACHCGGQWAGVPTCEPQPVGLGMSQPVSLTEEVEETQVHSNDTRPIQVQK